MTSEEKPQKPLLWSSMEARLIDPDLKLDYPDEAIELFRRITAPKRCKDRREATTAALDAAEKEIKRRGEARGIPVPDRVRGWLVMMDHNGIGGIAGAGGSSQRTARMPWAQELGSGRWHANDGGAYRKALESQDEYFEGHPKLDPYEAAAVYLLLPPDEDPDAEPDPYPDDEDDPSWVIAYIRSRVLLLMEERREYLSPGDQLELHNLCHMLRVLEAAEKSGDTSDLVGFARVIGQRQCRYWR